MSIKKIIGRLHLWVGLASGALIVFLGLTGCILAFQKEIEGTFQSYRYVEPRSGAMLPPSRLSAIGAAELPGKHLHAVLYEGRSKAAQVIFFSFEPESYYYIIFVDPYTGAIQKVKNMDRDFFRQVINGHFYLWLPPHIGQPIVASGTLVFGLMLISGIVLWWPRNRAARKQRFSVKWSASPKRRNYDLHNVLGFYASWVCLVIAITGLVWGFQWFAKGLQGAAGGGASLVYTEPLSDTTRSLSAGAPAVDRIWEKMKREHRDAQIIEVHIPGSKEAPVAANANPDASTYWKTDYRYFDQYSLEELPAQSIYGRYGTATAGDKLIRANYDIHTGSILGLPGKILMFFASLIAASLPVTGFLIWKGRRKKKRKEGAVPVNSKPQQVPVYA